MISDTHNPESKTMRINKFFCINLRTCGMIIGYLELATGILAFAFIGIMFSGKHEF